MTALIPYTRVCVLAPRMTDDEVALYDPWAQGVPWSNRLLLGAAQVDGIDSIREGQTLLSARTDTAAVEIIMRMTAPGQFIPTMGVVGFDERIPDWELELVDSPDIAAFDVIEIGTSVTDPQAIEDLISALPFTAYRLEHGRTAPLVDARPWDFDWKPILMPAARPSDEAPGQSISS